MQSCDMPYVFPPYHSWLKPSHGMLTRGETSYLFESHLYLFCEQNIGPSSNGMVNLVQIKKPNYSRGTALESYMMNEAVPKG